MDPWLPDAVDRAVARLDAELRPSAPFLADRVATWMHALAGSSRPADYFLHPSAFPSLQLPLWLERSLAGQEPDRQRQADLVYSTVSGYYFIRLLDDVMDGEAGADVALLPAAAVFHSEFHAVYQRLFPPETLFWSDYRAEWFGAAEAAVRDAGLEHVDERLFREVTRHKLRAARIPLAAVCHLYGRRDRFPAWCELCDALAGWSQLANDLLGWGKDQSLGLRTFLRGEAERRRRPGESEVEWVAREGFAWAVGQLEGQLGEARRVGAGLASSDVERYLEGRAVWLSAKRAALEPGLLALSGLARALRAPGTPSTGEPRA